MAGPTVVDLFCGAGGFSLGLQKAGFHALKAVDANKHAVATYRANLGEHVEETWITEDMEIPPCDLIAGGPPCQGFSSAGRRREGDERNTLVSVFAKLIAKNRPKAFLFENVEGFLTGEGGQRVLDLLEPVIAAGYRVHLRKVNVANYGVPQHRKRVIAFGLLGFDSDFVAPTRGAHGAPGAHLEGSHLPPTVTVAEALAGLPAPAIHGCGEPQGHVATALAEDDLLRVHALVQGGTMRDLPEELWHTSYKRRANRRVMDGTPTEQRGGAPAGIRRLIAKEPSKAITSFARSEFVHPTEDRFLTIRECARIQTFPDTYEFHGRPADQALLIGNAVPPVFGEALGRHLLAQMAAAKGRKKEGALLSFVPTASEGQSPALKATTVLVTSKFVPANQNGVQLSLCL